MPMNPINATISSTGTYVYGVDWRTAPNGYAYQVVFNAGASGSVTVDTTLDNVNDASVTPVWTTGTALTGTTVGTIGSPVQFIRLSANSLSGGTLSFKILEGAPDSGSTTGGGGGGSTSNVNIAQVAGATVATGHGTAAGALRVELPTDGTGVVGLNASSNIIGNVRIDQTLRGSTNAVTLVSTAGTAALISQPSDSLSNSTNSLFTAALNSGYGGATWNYIRTIQGAASSGLGVTAVAAAPTSVAAAGVTPVGTTVAASNVVVKGTPGNLYGFDAASGASAGYVMVFNATSLPANGTVTPLKVYNIAANSSMSITYNPPLVCSTGITLGFSTTGPFSLTASTTAFLSGDAA